MDTEKTEIYHERQKLQLCILHCLNNLFQEKDAFTRTDLNSIAQRLDHDDPYKGRWTPFSLVFKPHHNVVTGNYDVNVLIAALENKGKRVVWHDRRTGFSTMDFDGTESKLMGIVLNVPVKRYAGLWKSRHWVALRRIGGSWYDLDSDFAAPHEFKGSAEVGEFLDGAIADGAEALLVMHGDDK